MKNVVVFGLLCLLSVTVIGVVDVSAEQDAKKPASAPVDPTKIKDIKAYCLDFNWGRRRSFAKPGTWASADPAKHVAWYKAMGANVIQTFAVSCNGYAWYKNGAVPEQPGLKHDFLTEVVRLGHKEGMQTLNQSLANLVMQRTITKEEALKHCSNPERFEQTLQDYSQGMAKPAAAFAC